jgi:hypothetical protein
MLCLFNFLNGADDNNWLQIGKLLKEKWHLDSFRDYIAISNRILDKVPNEPSDSNVIFNIDESSTTEVANLVRSHSFDFNSVIGTEENTDYSYFKSHPFVKISATEYGVVSSVFLSNLLYQNLYFELSDISRTSNIFGSSFPSRFNKDFLEDVLLGNLLHYMFENHNCEFLTDKSCSNMEAKIKLKYRNTPKENRLKSLLTSPPDGYIRENSSILLLECKGRTLSKDVVAGIASLEDDVKKNLVGKNGTGQLIGNISRIIAGDFLWDSSIPSDVNIYPILVVADSIFSVEGLNDYVNSEVINEYKSYDKHIRPITIIDMDTLILISENIHTGEIDLSGEIDLYYEYVNYQPVTVKSVEDLTRKHVSFSMFIRDKYELKSPLPLLSDLGSQLN